MKRLVEEVFATEGVPQYTFVPPPNFNDIYLDVRRVGKPVIIEGQSGTGKTTCIKKIIERLGREVGVSYLTARQAADVTAISQLLKDRQAGTFVIDDFHRLAPELQAALADLAKTAAELAGAGDPLPKLILVGINEVGTGLIQLVPDIAKRVGIHKVQPGTQTEVSELVSRGCGELGVVIADTAQIFQESQGDYWLTQQLCQTICTMDDVTETVPAEKAPKALQFNLVALRGKVVERLRAAYYPAVKEFCRGRRFRASNDPYFKLLRAVAAQDSSIVDLNALANANQDVRGSINNIKDRRLGVLLQSKPNCARHFYYNDETKSFALEDPALFYFLKHLDWDRLRTDCGFKAEAKDYEFDIAISFAGENREVARFLCDCLEVLDASVFYDENFEINFLGKAWNAQFQRIFSEDSRLVVCLLDKHHLQKIWPTFERECFVPRVADGEVIPIYLDDTKFVGIPHDTVGFMFKSARDTEAWKKEIEDIAIKLVERAA
jgi:hypothetical protein